MCCEWNNNKLSICARGKSLQHAKKFDDPVEEKIFWVIGKMQEFAIPLITGVFLALICANASPNNYL